MNEDTEKKAVQGTILKLSVFAVAMFAFCLFVLPPLYDLFCDIAGLNGKTKGKSDAVEAVVDTSRTVEVQFVSINNEAMPWEFRPSEEKLLVHPGQAVTTHFYVKNPEGHIMVGQAVPSMVPHNATDYFHKTECFCFNQQTLAPSEDAELGLQFIVDQDMPKAVNTIVLSYTLFDVTDRMPELIKEKELELSAAASASENLTLTATNMQN